ncbi:MAG: RraA family protein [Acetivibrionales bacterium]|jgi:4-hydroxy-4-methyl-2-oxoglutarate aldolase
MTSEVKKLCDAFMELSTPSVSDAMDKLQIKCGCHGLVPIVMGKKFVGPAFTVRYEVAGQFKTQAGDYIDDAEEGDVIVIDNGGRTYYTSWGDILTNVAVQKKLAGTVIDGVCRDVDGIRILDYPMYTRGHFMVTGKDRSMMVEVGGVVSICGVQCRKGDLVMADGSGVLIIPQEVAPKVLELARSIHEAEQKIIDSVMEGSTLLEARKKYKYDSLQRPENK